MCSRVKYYMVIMLTIFTILALMGWERKYFPVIISFNALVHRAAKSDRTLLIQRWIPKTSADRDERLSQPPRHTGHGLFPTRPPSSANKSAIMLNPLFPPHIQ